MTAELTMQHFLEVVRDHSTHAREVLLEEGFHPNVIYRKAEKAGRKGYTEWGVIVDRPWLTPEGREFLGS